MSIDRGKGHQPAVLQVISVRFRTGIGGFRAYVPDFVVSWNRIKERKTIRSINRRLRYPLRHVDVDVGPPRTDVSPWRTASMQPLSQSRRELVGNGIAPEC